MFKVTVPPVIVPASSARVAVAPRGVIGKEVARMDLPDAICQVPPIETCADWKVKS